VDVPYVRHKLALTHVHMDDSEVVVTRLCTGIFVRVKLRWCLQDTFESPEVLCSLVFGEVATGLPLEWYIEKDTEQLLTIPCVLRQCSCCR
jgi:hypothetical protein